MQVVSSSEFATHQQKYLDLARREQLLVNDGKHIFEITYQPIVEEPIYFEPDEDFYRAITAEELLKGVHEDIRRKFALRK
jgi:DNA replication initiation complex subunit (GINS family)